MAGRMEVIQDANYIVRSSDTPANRSEVKSLVYKSLNFYDISMKNT